MVPELPLNTSDAGEGRNAVVWQRRPGKSPHLLPIPLPLLPLCPCCGQTALCPPVTVSTLLSLEPGSAAGSGQNARVLALAGSRTCRTDLHCYHTLPASPAPSSPIAPAPKTYIRHAVVAMGRSQGPWWSVGGTAAHALFLNCLPIFQAARRGVCLVLCSV